MKDVVIVSAVRTPIGRFQGALSSIPATELGGKAIHGALAKINLDPKLVQEVFMGSVLQANLGQAPARQAALAGGLSQDVPCTTVNKVCASGMKAIALAANAIRVGDVDIAVAGGMENMSQAPHVIYGMRSGVGFGQQQAIVDSLFASLMDPVGGLYMAQTAEKIAKRLGITREQQDEYALRSHQLGAKAVQSGRFAAEIVPVTVKGRKGDELVSTDDHIKPDTTLEGLAKLRAAFGKDGTVTAGNASGIGLLAQFDLRIRRQGRKFRFSRHVGGATNGTEQHYLGREQE